MEIRSNHETPLAITVREMSRCAAALLDEVQAGRRIVISRYGRPAAVLAPVEDADLAAEFRRWHAEPRYIPGFGSGEDSTDDAIDLGGLSAEQLGYFQSIGDADPEKWSPATREEFFKCGVPIFELDVRRFVEGHSGYFWLTSRGRRALTILRGAGR